MAHEDEKNLEHSIEFARTIHHIVDHKHCEKIIKPLCTIFDDSANTILRNQACLSSSADVINIVGKVFCECDEQLASLVSTLAVKALPLTANQVKNIVKTTGPLSVVIGMTFVAVDVAKASDEKKVERLVRGSAKVALTTGAGVLGTALLGPVGTFSFTLIASWLGDFCDGE